jgi:glycosyltransferase involved in cell wall biosynthesis
MPVFNGESYLRAAIDSILNQTFTDFRFIIIDDGSTDSSVDIIKSYTDQRIELVQNETNLKLIATLNKGLEMCKADYIVRMDADDLSLPKRIEKQVEFMDAHPDVVCSGTWFTDFDDNYSKDVRYETEDTQIRIRHLYQTQIAHPTAIWRNDCIKKHNLKFDFSFPHCEDYEFWTRMGHFGRLANIPEFLVRKREHQNKVSNQFACIQVKSCSKVKANEMERIGVMATENDVELYERFAYADFTLNESELYQLKQLLIGLLSSNAASNYLNPKVFQKYISDKWYATLSQSKVSGKVKRKLIAESQLILNEISFLSKVKLGIKALLQ